MVADKERREVAKALREANFYMSYRSKRDMWDELRRIVGEYNDQPFGGVYTFARLADLIDQEQGGTCAECAEFDRASKITPRRAFHGHTEADATACDDFKPMKCDRDALLELADEMQISGANSLDDDDWCKGLLYEYAARIREALGVEK